MDPNDPLFTQLQQVQTRLGLTDRDTQLPDLIMALTHANPQRRADLEFYANTFRTMAHRQFPIHASDRRELEYLRQVLTFQPEDVQAVEQRVLTDLGLIADPFSRETGGDEDFSQFTDPAISHTDAARGVSPTAPPAPSGRSRLETPSYDSDVMASHTAAPSELPPTQLPDAPTGNPTPTVQDSYAGSGSYAVTQPSPPLSRNKEAVQEATLQKLQRQMGRSPDAEMPPSQPEEPAGITPEMRETWALGHNPTHGDVPPTVAPDPLTATQPPAPTQAATPQTELQPDGSGAAPPSPPADGAQAGESSPGSATAGTATAGTATAGTATAGAAEAGIAGAGNAEVRSSSEEKSNPSTVEKAAPPKTSAPSSGNSSSPGNADTSSPPQKKPLFLDTRFLVLFFMLLAAATGMGVVWWMTTQNKAAVTVDPQRSREYMESGMTKTQDGYLKQALQDLDRAVQLNPKDPNVYINRGYAHHRAGDLNAAVRDYDQAIALDGNLAQAFSNRSHARFDQGNYREAENDAKQAIARDSTLAEAYINLGNALFVRNDLDGAAQQFQQALQLSATKRTKARAYNNRGNIFLARQQHAEAKQEYDQAIQLDDTYADAFFNRAIAQERMENWQAAADDFTRAAQLYQKLGRDRRSREAQVKADQARQRQQSTPLPPNTTPDPTQRSI